MTASPRLRGRSPLRPQTAAGGRALLTAACLLAGHALASAATPSPHVPEPHDGFAELATKSGAVLVRTDLSLPAVKWQSAGSRGRVPAGWADLTTWPEAVGNFSRVVLDGVPMLQVEARKAAAWDLSLRTGVRLGELQAGVTHRLRVRLTAPGRTRVRLSVESEEGGRRFWDHLIDYVGAEPTLREYSWTVPADAGPVNLVVGLERSGEFQLSELTLETIDRDTFAAALSGARTGASANALRATRFPLGLPPRWYLDRWTSDDERPVGADRAVAGPSGAPSLHIPPAPRRAADQAAAGPVTLVGETFAVARHWEPQVASFSARGDATVTVSVRSGFETLATERFTLSASDGWRRLGVPFRPLSLSHEYQLQFLVDGELWLDGLRVAAGSAGKPETFAYAPPSAAEVALASPAPSRAVFAEDPADAPGGRVEWAVLPPAGGFAAGSVLRAKVVNLYDQQLPLPDAPLAGAGALSRGHWTLPEFPGKPFGAHRVEAWVEDKAGKRLSAVDELVVYRLPRPRYWGRDGEDSYFGIHVNANRRHLEGVKVAGANWVRLHDAGVQYIGWYFLEKERGKWTWDDAAIRRYRDHHLMILGQFGTAPAWASALGRVGPSGWLDRYYLPEDKPAWENYVKTITRRYRNDIHYWDVWNEPWAVSFGKSDARKLADGSYQYLFGKNPPAAFAELTRATAAAARSIDPAAKIVGLNTDTGSDGAGTDYAVGGVPVRRYPGADWTRLVAAAGGLEGADVIGYHHYINGYLDVIGYEGDWPEGGRRSAIGSLADPATSQPPLPVWMKEGSAMHSLTGRGFYYHGEPFPDAGTDDGRRVSDHLLRYITSILSTGTKKVFLYSAHKYGFTDDGVRFRVLLSEDGYLHPSAVAYAALARRIDGRPFVKALQLTPETRAYVFADRSGEGWTAVLIPRAFATPSTVSLKDAGELRVDDIFGNPLPPGAPAPRGVFFAGGDGAFADSSLDALRPSAP